MNRMCFYSDSGAERGRREFWWRGRREKKPEEEEAEGEEQYDEEFEDVSYSILLWY